MLLRRRKKRLDSLIFLSLSLSLISFYVQLTLSYSSFESLPKDWSRWIFCHQCMLLFFFYCYNCFCCWWCWCWWWCLSMSSSIWNHIGNNSTLLLLDSLFVCFFDQFNVVVVVVVDIWANNKYMHLILMWCPYYRESVEFLYGILKMTTSFD